jgi:ATP-dependent Clp protease adaptor protein ClpS
VESVSVAPPEHASPDVDLDVDAVEQTDQPWVTVVWNDPVNLMSYVSWVFQTYFGYSRSKAEKLMMTVHREGRAVVSSGPRERMETDTEAMQSYGLWATFEKDS